MPKPLVIEFFAGQGGSARGWELAGFEVICSDLFPQPRNPYPFIQGDALELIPELVRKYRPAVVSGGPPRQGYSDTQRIQGNEHPKLIAPVRELFEATGLPYLIENVDGAAEELKNPVMLCGAQFGLRTYRHRWFESNVPLTVPEHREHRALTVKMGRPLVEGDWYHAVGNFSNVPYVRQDMGVPWMTRDGIRECIPPAYTEYIGRQLHA